MPGLRDSTRLDASPSSAPPPTATERSALLDWYERNRRKLPWRGRNDPWAILVSEVMLQQTRVEVVVRYFERFLVRFPNPESLARAEESELLAAWSGLGYYRRARSLAAIARAVVASGGWPRSAADLARLPGVGPYTAAAIASIAFDEPIAVVDGNVIRVQARRLALGAERVGAAQLRAIRAAAQALVDPQRPGDSNQALMELGATVCLPRRADCPRCPLAGGCRGRLEGAPERYPAPRPRRRPVATGTTAALVVEGDRLLLARRADDAGVLAGLWELPTIEAESADAAAFAARFGGEWRIGGRRALLRHTITFRALSIAVHAAEWRPTELGEGAELGWFERARAPELALTGATRKALGALEASAEEKAGSGGEASLGRASEPRPELAVSGSRGRRRPRG